MANSLRPAGFSKAAAAGRLGTGSQQEIPDPGLSLAESTRRKEGALALLREYELAEKKGNLVALADVEKVWDSLITTCRSRLLSLPSKLAPLVSASASAAECKGLIENELHQALSELKMPDAKSAARPRGKKKKS